MLKADINFNKLVEKMQEEKKQNKRYITVEQRKRSQEKRLAEQLRANLQKRKAQARQRKAEQADIENQD